MLPLLLSVFCWKHFLKLGSDFSTLGCGKTSQNVMIPEKGLREFLTQIPGLAAPPGGPLARGETQFWLLMG